MEQLLQKIGEHIGIIAVGGTVSLTFILMTISKIVAVRSKERTRREVAAYVAEGSMTTDEAERILTAGGDAEGGCCGGKGRRRASSTEAVS